MLRGNKILCAKPGSNVQHGHHVHKCYGFLRNRQADQVEILCGASLGSYIQIIFPGAGGRG